jgi:hypothetical protein
MKRVLLAQDFTSVFDQCRNDHALSRMQFSETAQILVSLLRMKRSPGE